MKGRERVPASLKAAICGIVATAIAFPISAAAGPVLGDPCPNGDVRKAQGTAFLPDCMALERVSPPKKDNQGAQIFYFHVQGGEGPSGGFSADGDRVLFKSQGALAGTPALNNFSGDDYVATRNAGAQNWETSPTSAPGGLIKGWNGIPIPESISADLSRWFEVASTLEQFRAGLGQVFRGGVGGEFRPFSPFLTPLSGTPAGAEGNISFGPRGSSADSSRVYFTADLTIGYLPGDPTPAGSGAVDNTYIAHLDPLGNPDLELLARDGAGTVWGGNCGAGVGGDHPFLSSARDRGAISADGSRTYFTTRPAQPATGSCSTANKKRIMVREEGPGGAEIRELFQSECDRAADPGPPEIPACGKTLTGPAPPPGGNTVPDGDDVYEGASIEGTTLYFTTSRQLADSDLNGLEGLGLSGCVGSFGVGIGGCDLYLYDASGDVGEQLTQVTAGSSGQTAPSIAAISGDGSRAYFNSSEVLTADPGPGGGVAQAGQSNLYVYEAGADELSFIATTTAGSAYPVPVLGPDPTALGVGGDGYTLFFTSSASLTADDTDGGAGDVFRYDARQEALVRITRAEAGVDDKSSAGIAVGSALGDAAGPNSPHFVGFARWVSDDGRTVGFKTAAGLAADDNNGVLDSYAWHGGEVFRLPGTSDAGGTLRDRPIVSPAGGALAFQTYQPLLPSDGDGAIDVYTARVGGGFDEPEPPLPCVLDGAEGCRDGAGPPPASPSPASATFPSSGNVVERPKPKLCGKGKRRVKRNGKARCVPRVKAHRSRKTDNDRRAGK